MRHLFGLILSLGFLNLSFASPALAASRVEFQGGAENFVFNTDGSSEFFDGLEGMMPGDTRSETVTVKNTTTEYDYVKIYLCVVPETEDDAFLSKLILSIKNNGTLISDSNLSAATTNLELGSFNPNDESLLTLELLAPATLGNDFQYAESGINWIFTAEAYKDGKIVPPNTGAAPTNDATYVTPGIVLAVAVALLLLLIINRKRISNISKAPKA